MSSAAALALTASGGFLLLGLATGIWKYRHILTSSDHRAPVYVDIAHRASLMYSFTALVMMTLVEHSPYSERVQILATGIPIFFFLSAIASYVWHGLRQDTDNQFERRSAAMTFWMALLIAGELGGVSVLVWGFLASLLEQRFVA